MTAVTRRVRDVTQLPDDALACAAAGRHLGFFDHVTVSPESTGTWGDLDARQVTYRCDCTRIKEETIDWNTGETLSRSAVYSGGVLTYEPLPTRDAKRELLHRKVARASGAGVLNGRRTS